MRKSILRRLKWAMMAFGLAMGIIFPLYANYFVIWKEGMLGFFVAGAVGAGITVGLVNHFLVKYILVNRLMEISRLADALNASDLSVSLETDSDDAVGEIVRGLNESIASLRGSVTEYRCFADELFEILEGGNSSHGKGLFGVVTSLSESERNIAISSAEEKTLSAQGRDTIGRIRLHFDKTNDLMGDLKKVNSNLVKKSSEIDKNIKAIEEVAAKINLISMNATVESVRAGEHGRSFGEVAKEIQALSVVSTQTANSIHDLIAEITSEIQETSHSIETLETSIMEDIYEIKASEELFEKINSLISNTDVNIRGTLSSIEEISSTNERLSGIAANMKNIADSFQLD